MSPSICCFKWEAVGITTGKKSCTNKVILFVCRKPAGTKVNMHPFATNKVIRLFIHLQTYFLLRFCKWNVAPAAVLLRIRLTWIVMMLRLTKQTAGSLNESRILNLSKKKKVELTFNLITLFQRYLTLIDNSLSAANGLIFYWDFIYMPYLIPALLFNSVTGNTIILPIGLLLR